MNMHLSTLDFHLMFPHLPAENPDPKPEKPVRQPPMSGPKHKPIEEPSDTPSKLPPYVPVEEPSRPSDEEPRLVFRQGAEHLVPKRTLH